MKKLIFILLALFTLAGCTKPTLENSVEDSDKFTTVEMQNLPKDTVVVSVDGVCEVCSKQGYRHCAHPEECGNVTILNRSKLTNGFITVVKEKSTRERAMEWWNNLCRTDKVLLMKEELSDRHPQSLTGREIEKIWKEKFNNLFESFLSEKRNSKGLVDFEMLTASIRTALRGDIISEYQRNNFNLFFQKLSESGSFAHKAHKELQRLNK